MCMDFQVDNNFKIYLPILHVFVLVKLSSSSFAIKCNRMHNKPRLMVVDLVTLRVKVTLVIRFFSKQKLPPNPV